MGHGPHIPTPRAPQLTHFLGLSLVTPASRPQLQAALETFRDAARNDKELNIPEEVAKHAIRPVDTLHLTLCTFSLPPKEPEKLEQVINHLKEIDLKKFWQEAQASKHSQCNDLSQSEGSPQASPSMEQITSPAEDKQDSQDHLVDSLPPLCVTLKGMSTMRNAASTTVVYAPPDDPSGTLQSFCESILENLKPYLPKEATPRQSEQETAKEESKPPARPALESFPHPDSYKSVISVLAAPAPPVPQIGRASCRERVF